MRLPIIDGNPEKINEPLAAEMLHYAIDQGVNYIDTAYPYHGASAAQGGMSEIFVGNALKDGYREQVNISTKLPSWLIEKKEDLNYYLDMQLKRLQTDRIEFYLLHGLGENTWQNLKELDVLEFLDSALEDGRIKYAGFSYHDEVELFKEIVDSYNWSFGQIQYNYMDENFQAGKEGLDYIAARDMGTVIMEPLRGGCLTNNIPPDIQAVWDKASVKRSPVEWALRFLWDQPEIDVVLSGMNTMEQVIENIDIAERSHANSLTSAEKSLIQEVKSTYTEKIHAGCTGCNYCMPCPNGVDIPMNLNLLNDLYIYQNMEKPTGSYAFIKAKNANASVCDDCGECEEKCTQKLPIRKYLKEAVATFEKSD